MRARSFPRSSLHLLLTSPVSLLVLFGWALLGLSAAPAQPTLVGESFSDGLYEPDDLTTYSPGSSTLLCFDGSTTYDGDELFCYNGTSLTQVTNLERASSSASPEDFVVYDAGSGPELFFGAFGPDGKELYAYDGTSVRQVADIYPGRKSSRPADLAVFRDTLYFQAQDGNDGYELWQYDGSTVEQVEDINSGGASSEPEQLTVYRDTLFFRADGGTDGEELWAYDGTDTTQVADIHSGSSDATPQELTVFGDTLYFAVDDDGTQLGELWQYDGSVSRVSVINSESGGFSGDAFINDLTIYDGALYFQANDGDTGRELWSYDGTDTTQVADINPGAEASFPSGLEVYDPGSGATLYFVADGGTDGEELWQYDGSTTSQVADFNSGPDGSNIYDLTVYDGFLYFQGGTPTSTDKLRRYDGQRISTPRFSNNRSGGPREKIQYDGDLYFEGINRKGAELWTYDGSNTSLVADIFSGREGSSPENFILYDDGTGSGTDLYFAADGDDGAGLWRYDGTDTTLVDPSRSFLPDNPAVYKGTLYFEAYIGNDGYELWQYDGSAITQVADINSGRDFSYPKDLTVYNDTLYFGADDGSSTENELWKYDGSSVSLAEDINPNGGSNPEKLTVYNGVLYFRARAKNDGAELWKYDGSTAAQVADVKPGSGSSYPAELTEYDGALYFTARGPNTFARLLWRYEGGKVSQVGTGSFTEVEDLAVFAGKLYFTAATDTDGREPYAYDGQSVSQIETNPGKFSGGGTDPLVYDTGSSKTLYVTATDGQSGLELYQFDESDPLPVEVASMSATQTGASSVQLSWETVAEQNNAGFRVQRRRAPAGSGAGTTNGDWTTLGFVESTAEGGTTSQTQSYQFGAENLPIGTHQFRLKQVDLDGSTTVHDVVNVELNMQQALRLSPPSPNPISGRATVSFAVKEKTQVEMALYNMLGQRVATIYRGTPSAEEAQTIDLSTSDLASGTYFLRLSDGDRTMSRKLTVVQ